jgi:hypothetical protein
MNVENIARELIKIARSLTDDDWAQLESDFVDKIVKKHRGRYYQRGLFEGGKSKAKAEFSQIFNGLGGVNVRPNIDNTKFYISIGDDYIGRVSSFKEVDKVISKLEEVDSLLN